MYRVSMVSKEKASLNDNVFLTQNYNITKLWQHHLSQIKDDGLTHEFSTFSVVCICKNTGYKKTTFFSDGYEDEPSDSHEL